MNTAGPGDSRRLFEPPIYVQYLNITATRQLDTKGRELKNPHSRPFVVPICMSARRYGDPPTRRFAAAARDPRVHLPHRRISPHSAGGSLLLLSENPGRGLPRK